jgi:hypothetical protein
MWPSLCLVALLIASVDALRVHQDRFEQGSVEREVLDLDRYLIAASQRLEGMLATSPTQPANRTAAVTKAESTPAAKAPTMMHVNTTKLKQANTTKKGINNTQLKQESDSLSNLFAHLKSNIANSNKAQVESKKNYALEAAEVQQRLDHDRKRLQQKNLSKFDHEFYTNRTLSEERELHYWNRQRDLNHGMFHDTLKMTHGLMSRVKTVMDAYKDLMKNGHLDPKLAEQLHSVSASIPKHTV